MTETKRKFKFRDKQKMIVHFSFLFVSEPQFFVCLLILKQMPISVKALTAEGGWRTKQRFKEVFIRDKWKIKV